MHNTMNTIILDKLSLEKPLRENQFYRWEIILNFSKSRDTKFLASYWQNFDNLLIYPADIPHCYSHANTAPLLTLQDYSPNFMFSKCPPDLLLYYSCW